MLLILLSLNLKLNYTFHNNRNLKRFSEDGKIRSLFFELLSLAAEVYEPATGIVMKVITDQPALQFYSGNFMDGVDTGKRGEKHNYRTGIALETQNYPDAPNHANFPNSVLKAGETYKHVCVYKFEVKK